MFCKERADRPTPNGGSYSEIYYQDNDDKAADKEIAIRCEIIEYDTEGKFKSSILYFLEKKIALNTSWRSQWL